MDFTQDKYSALWTIEEMKILGAVLELQAKQPIYLKIGPNCPHIFWVYYFSLSQCGN